MRRSKRDKDFFVAFDYTDDALREIDRHFKADRAVIIPLTVKVSIGRENYSTKCPAASDSSMKKALKGMCSAPLGRDRGFQTDSRHTGRPQEELTPPSDPPCAG